MQIFFIIINLFLITNVHALKTIFLDQYQNRPILEKKSTIETDRLVILLHPVSVGIHFINFYYPLKAYTESLAFNLVIPSGNKNLTGEPYWNAGEACCDFDKIKNNDLLFLDRVIEHYQKKFNAKKIYLVGHSNGAFMAQHYACHGKYPLSGVFSFAGNPSSNDLLSCKEQDDFTLILAHGPKDRYVPYQSGELRRGGHHSISVVDYLTMYRHHMKCQELALESLENLTFNRLGKDFKIYQTSDCANNSRLFFWDHFKGGHIPLFKKKYFRKLLKTLFSIDQ